MVKIHFYSNKLSQDHFTLLSIQSSLLVFVLHCSGLVFLTSLLAGVLCLGGTASTSGSSATVGTVLKGTAGSVMACWPLLPPLEATHHWGGSVQLHGKALGFDP